MQLFQVSFTPWADNTITLSHWNERAGDILGTVTADASEQWSLGLKPFTPTVCPVFSFLCSEALRFGGFKAEDILNSRALSSARLHAEWECKVTVSELSSCLLLVVWAQVFGIQAQEHSAAELGVDISCEPGREQSQSALLLHTCACLLSADVPLPATVPMML